MDSVEFTKGSRPALLVEVANATKYVSQGLKGFQGVTTPHCIASMKKFTVYNKTAANLKIVQRLTGKGGDLEVASPVLDMVALDYDSDYCVAALENGTVVVLRCTENPDNSVAAVVEDTFPVTDVVRVVVTQRGGTTHNASDATAGKLIVAVNSKGAVTLIHGKAVEPAGDVGGAVSAVGAGDGIVAFARGNRVIVRSADRLTESGLLSKPWLPHGDDTVDFVHVFRKSPTIVTSSGSEVRLWTVGKDVATLHQTVLINGLGPQTLKSTDPNDEYVFIVEKASGSTLVLEVNTKAAPVVERVTEWSLGEETVSISGALRKVANDAAARTDVALCARTSTGVSRFVFDGARLHGPVNVDPSANGGTTGNGGSDSVKKWFANTTPVSQPPAAMTPAGFTHITSTTGGLTTTKSSVDARAAQEALLDLQQNFAGILAQFDSQIVALERQASESLGVLRAGGAAASAAGEASARQVAGGLLSGASSNQQADSNAFVVNQDVLNGFTSAITEAATITVQHALAAGLKHHAANAADRALTIIANANSNDRETLQLPKVTQLPSMQALAEAIDKAQAQQNDLFRRQKEQDAAKYLSMVKLQQAKAAKGVADVKKYLNDLDSEIQGLKVDISSIQTWSSPAAAAEPIPETDDQIYGEAMRLAEAGQWGNALFKAANAGKLSVLSRFLDSDLIRANEGEVASTANLSVPLYVSIAQQLTSDIKDSVGFIPMRVQWLHAFTLAFDELLTDGKQSKTIDNVRADISNVVDALSAAEDHKGSLDRNTKRHITVVKKALQPHGL